MKPYLEPNATVAFLVEWGGFVLFLALVLAPFFIIRYRWFRPTRIWHIVGAYAASFGVFVLYEYITGVIHDDWLRNNFINYGWLSTALSDGELKTWLVLSITWPLSIFYSTKLLYLNLTKKRFFIALLIAVLFFLILITIMMFVVASVLGQIGQQYF